MKKDVIHGVDLRNRWKDTYVYLDDFLALDNLSVNKYEDARFSLFECGFSLDLEKHNVVENF